MIMLRTLYLFALFTLLLWAATLTTLAYADDVAAYTASRALIIDCQLDQYGEESDTGEPSLVGLPDVIYTGQSCEIEDTSDATGSLVSWLAPSGAIDRLSYSAQVCLPCAPTDGWTCTRQCYSVADEATTVSYAGNGREYEMASIQAGGTYDTHWIRREIDPDAPDPSAIFQLHLSAPARSVVMTLFYRLNAADD